MEASDGDRGLGKPEAAATQEHIDKMIQASRSGSANNRMQTPNNYALEALVI